MTNTYIMKELLHNSTIPLRVVTQLGIPEEFPRALKIYYINQIYEVNLQLRLSEIVLKAPGTGLH